MAKKLLIKRNIRNSSSSSSSSRNKTTARAHSRRTLKERRQRNRLIIVLVSFVLLIAGGFALGHFSFSPTVSISQVSVEGAALVPSTALKEIFSHETAAAYLGLFSKNNALLLPRKKIEQKITDQYKTVEKADISFDTFHNVVLSVTERKPAFLVCEPRNAATCFYADKTGYIFSEAPAFSGNVFIVWSGFQSAAQSDTKKLIDSRIMPEADFAKLNAFIENISKVGLKVISVTQISESELEFRVAKGGTVVINRNLTYDQTLQNLESVVAAQQAKTRGTFIDQFERIDVRFAGKAFVKVRGQ